MACSALNAALIVASPDDTGASICARPKDGPFQDLALDVLHHQIIRSDVIQLADVWVIERCDRAGLALESLGVLGLEALDCDDTIDSRVAGLPHLAHATRAKRSGQLVGAKSVPGAQVITVT